MITLDQLKRINNVLFATRGAVNKINIERMRGAGYRHSEVENLLRQEGEVRSLLTELRNISREGDKQK